MSEVTETIQILSEKFRVTIRPISLNEYKLFADSVKEVLNKTIPNIRNKHNMYVYFFLKERYPYLVQSDMAKAMGLKPSNYHHRVSTWDFDIKTYDDVKENIEKIKNFNTEN